MTVERYVPWAEARERMGWKQGEHVTLIGPTGLGKTTAALDLITMRDFPLVLATKPSGKDKTLMDFRKRERFRLITEWPTPTLENRVMLWPKFKVPEDVANQAKHIRAALRSAFVRGGYGVLVDEAWYTINRLGAREELETIWSQGRSAGVSLMVCSQRPTHIPLLAYDQATHLFMYRDADETNLKRMGGLGFTSAKTIISTVGSLEPYEILYLNTRDGAMFTTNTRR